MDITDRCTLLTDQYYYSKLYPFCFKLLFHFLSVCEEQLGINILFKKLDPIILLFFVIFFLGGGEGAGYIHN